jgi:hypothetical protein
VRHEGSAVRDDGAELASATIRIRSIWSDVDGGKERSADITALQPTGVPRTGRGLLLGRPIGSLKEGSNPMKAR